MNGGKSEKELAFLHDLFVATYWGERFAELIDEHIQLPKTGHALYLACGTGAHALALQQRAGADLKFLCVDENEECLELARAKATAMNEETEFHCGKLDAVYLSNDQFDLVLGDGSLVAPARLEKMLSEMVRVAQPGGTVALTLTTASSFGEFFSILWEALHKSNLDHEVDVGDLLKTLPTIAETEEMAAREGLADVTAWSRAEEFNYESGEEFFNAPLISDFLAKGWLESIPALARERVARESVLIIDEERHKARFWLTVKATLVTGRKTGSPQAG